ncbi:MAG: hypothetical protein IKI57_04325 [Clostridia bacterium]|nr:hypothetical protein [Clostridia bacterium]
MLKKIYSILLIITMLGSMAFADVILADEDPSGHGMRYVPGTRVIDTICALLVGCFRALTIVTLVLIVLKLIFFIVHKRNGKFEKFNKVLKILLIISATIVVLDFMALVVFSAMNN